MGEEEEGFYLFENGFWFQWLLCVVYGVFIVAYIGIHAMMILQLSMAWEHTLFCVFDFFADGGEEVCE